MTKQYQVMFSVLIPREGYTVVNTDSEENAKKIITDLMGDNYKDLRIIQVLDMAEVPKPAVAEMEQTEETKVIN